MRAGLLYDPHCPYHDKQAFTIALDHLMQKKLDLLVLGGDFVDFYKISYFKSDPNRMGFEDEVKECRKILIDIRKRFPKIPIHYIEGNHEVRLHAHVRDNAPELLWNNKIENMLHLGARNIDYFSNIGLMCQGQEPYKLGKLYVLHGHEKKVSFGAVNLARLFYLKCKVNVVAGHHHRPDKYLVRPLNGRHEAAFTVGTLGQLSEAFQPINDWTHGFAYVDVLKNGYFNFHNRIIIGGQVVEF